ncbi:MAG: LysR family transcriptional regulator [Plesiomonas sp.]|uniref:LysR family transcriptional regulator n=1 Tax=Plesiomonas sp. TaxID=2486279 RepID=UPI003F2CFF4E
MRLKIEDMVMFAKVSDTLNFNKAADELNIPSSTLSRRIYALEKALNVPLFDRSTRHVELTDAGKKIITYCNEIIRKKNELEYFIDANYNQGSGTLVVVASHSAASLLSKKFLPSFINKYNNITITLKSSTDINDEIEGDILITSMLPKNDCLVATKIGTLTRSFFVSNEYIQRYGSPLSLQDLKHHTVLHVGNAFEQNLTMYYYKMGIEFPSTPPNLNIKCLDVFHAIEDAVNGRGILWTSALLVEKQLSSGELHILFNESFDMETPCYAVYKYLFNQPKKITAFILELKSFIDGYSTRHY